MRWAFSPKSVARTLRRPLLAVVASAALAACGMASRGAPGQPDSSVALSPSSSPPVGAAAKLGGALGARQSGDLKVWLFSAPNPPTRGNDELRVLVTDAAGAPLTDAEVSFDLDMTNMSHGKNVVVASPAGAGLYTGKVHFLMPGPWRAIVSVQRAGTAASLRFEFGVNWW